MSKTFYVFNETKQCFLSLGVSPADTWFTRLRGLLGRRKLDGDEGLWIVPSQGVHTIGMMFPIDVVYLDARKRVVHVIERLSPFRIAPIRINTRSVLELPAGTISSSETQVGDTLMICSPEKMQSYWEREDSREPAAQASSRSNTTVVREGFEKAGSSLRRVFRKRRRPAAGAAPPPAPAAVPTLEQAKQSGSVVAYYWTGGSPVARPVSDLQPKSAFIHGPESWYPGTLLKVTFERPFSQASAGSDIEKVVVREDPPVRIVASRVTRQAPGGFEVQFLFTSWKEQRSFARFVASASQDVPAMAPERQRKAGQAMMELVLSVPLLMLVLLNTVNFAAYLHAWISVTNAARAGANYLILGGATAGAPRQPTDSQVSAIIAQDIAYLPNAGSVQVKICTKKNTTVSCSGSGGSTPPGDSEPTRFAQGTVSVSYNYTPLIAGFNFPSMGIHLTLPPTSITKTAAMRIMN